MLIGLILGYDINNLADYIILFSFFAGQQVGF